MKKVVANRVNGHKTNIENTVLVIVAHCCKEVLVIVWWKAWVR